MVSILFSEGVQHVEAMLWLQSGTGIGATLDALEQSADEREIMGHPVDFINGVRAACATVRAHYGLTRAPVVPVIEKTGQSRNSIDKASPDSLESGFDTAAGEPK